LMVSANEQHQSARLRLTKAQFDTVKRDLETHVLETYPELKQRKIVTAEREDKKISHKASKQKQRTGKLERQESVRATISEAMVHARSFEDFKAYLEAKHYNFYTRGKHYGVEVTHDTGKIAKYRFATIGAHEDFEVYLAALEQLKEAQAATEEVQEAETKQKATHGKEKEEPTPQPSPEVRKDEDIEERRSDGLKKPSPKRQEQIDKGNVTPDPDRDLMGHDEWRDQDTFSTKVQQSWRRTMDDFRGRTKNLEERGRGDKGDDEGQER